MAEFRPFRGIRYNEERTRNLTKQVCPPYDILSPDDQEALYESHPHNAVRLDFGKTFPGDSDDDNRYSRAAACFREWLSEGILVQDEEPAYYLLEEQFEDERGEKLVRYGIMGLKRLEENREGTSVRPHEATYAAPKQDRLLLMKATESNFSPIFAVYRDPSFTIEKLFTEGHLDDACAEAVGHDQVLRRLFVLKDRALVERLEKFLSGSMLLIADGHHRYETALAYRDWRRSGEPDAEGPQPYDYTLMYISNMESPGLCVYPAHRILRDDPGLDPERFLRSAAEIFQVKKEDMPGDPQARERFLRSLRDAQPGSVRIGCCFKKPDTCFLLCMDDANNLSEHFPPETPTSLRTLDVIILHEIVLGKCLGLSREEQGKEGRLAYAKGEGKALDLLDREPELRAAFLLNPPPIRKIMEIAFDGILLPHKATYFYPKAVTGLLFRKM